MPDARKKRRRRKPDPETSDTDTVVEYTSDEEAGSTSPSARSRSPSPPPRDCWRSDKDRWESARDFLTLFVVGFVLIDLYARAHATLWWTPDFDMLQSHTAFTEDNAHPIPVLPSQS